MLLQVKMDENLLKELGNNPVFNRLRNYAKDLKENMDIKIKKK